MAHAAGRARAGAAAQRRGPKGVDPEGADYFGGRDRTFEGRIWRRDGKSVFRMYGIGAQILRDLGLSKIRVLSAPKQMHAISGFDLEITEYVDS